MENIFETNKQINAKIGADTEGATTFDLVKAQVAKLGGDTSKVVDIRTGEQQVLEHIKPAGPDVVIQNSKDVSISANGTTVVSPDEGYDAIKDVVVDVNVPDPELEELSVTANGTYTPTKYGYSKVDVAVPSKPEQTKTITITENGTTSVLPDEGSVLNKVDVTVNVAGGAVVFHGSNPQFKGIEGDFPTNVEFPDLTSCDSMFFNCDKLTTVPLFDTSNVTNMNNMFALCSKLTTVPLFDTSNVTIMNAMLQYCSSLTSVPLFDTSNVTNMSDMFEECSSLKTLPLFDTSNVTDMSFMFYGCYALTTVPLFDTSNVTDMNHMFSDCSKLTTVPLFDTSKVTDMHNTFRSCNILVTVPQFDTSNVTNMSGMFISCKKLTTVPQLDASNVTDISDMFNGCNLLTNFGGLLNIGQSYTTTFTYSLYDCKKLSKESIQNVIDGLYDMTAKGFSPTLKLYSTVKNKLTNEQKQQITNKNWRLK